jgi:hypothetical protein
MSRLVPMAKKLVTAVVAVGILSAGVGGVLEATPAGAAPAVFTKAPKVGRHFNCARAEKVLTRIERTESQVSKGLPSLSTRQAKAKAHGRANRANRLQKLISRLESPQFKTNLAKAAQAIEAKCHVSAPSTSSTTT